MMKRPAGLRQDTFQNLQQNPVCRFGIRDFFCPLSESGYFDEMNSWNSLHIGEHMNAKRLLLLVVGCTCCLAGWGAELKDLDECSTIKNESDRLVCFERITRILVDQKASVKDQRDKTQGGSERKQAPTLETTGEGKRSVREVDVETSTEEAVRAELGAVLGNETTAVAAEITAEGTKDEQVKGAKKESRDPSREIAVSIPVKNSDAEAATIRSDFGKRKESFQTMNLRSVIMDVQKSKVKKNIYILTLANGQVWRETQFGKGTSYRGGDSVTIKSSRMGSFVITNRRTGFSNHVSRID